MGRVLKPFHEKKGTGFSWEIISGVEYQRDAVSSVPGPSRLLERIRKEMSSSLPYQEEKGQLLLSL